MTGPSKNLAASVRARLLNHHERTGDDYNLLLVRYALERFLYRLGRSRHRANFVLKGAMLFQLWGGGPFRATRDLDLLGFGADATDAVSAVMREVCAVEVEDDGVVLDPDTVRAEEIRTVDEYGGVRVTFNAKLGSAVVPVQVDVGFGDALTPAPSDVRYPTLLDLPAPEVRAYSRETVIAEKLEAIVKLELLNTRFKDYFDLCFIAERFEVEGDLLARAVRNTFERRARPLPRELPAGLSDDFAAAAGKATQWAAFCKRSRVPPPHRPLAEVVSAVRGFLWPALRAAADPALSSGRWAPPGPWQTVR